MTVRNSWAEMTLASTLKYTAGQAGSRHSQNACLEGTGPEVRAATVSQPTGLPGNPLTGHGRLRRSAPAGDSGAEEQDEFNGFS